MPLVGARAANVGCATCPRCHCPSWLCAGSAVSQAHSVPGVLGHGPRLTLGLALGAGSGACAFGGFGALGGLGAMLRFVLGVADGARALCPELALAVVQSLRRAPSFACRHEVGSGLGSPVILWHWRLIKWLINKSLKVATACTEAHPAYASPPAALLHALECSSPWPELSKATCLPLPAAAQPRGSQERVPPPAPCQPGLLHACSPCSASLSDTVVVTTCDILQTMTHAAKAAVQALSMRQCRSMGCEAGGVAPACFCKKTSLAGNRHIKMLLQW